MKRLADFLTHHNSVPITFSFLFLASGTALATSPSVRDAVIGGAVTKTVSIDNSAIADADLEHFDGNMTVTTVTEDEQNYYVAYQYHTFSVGGAVWKEVPKDGVLTVAKGALQDSDLREYAIEQLRQVAESDLSYLKRVQAAEVANGRSRPLVVTSYRGLAGLAIEMKDILLPPAPIIEAPTSAESLAVPVLTAPVTAEVAPPASTPSADQQPLDTIETPVATTTVTAIEATTTPIIITTTTPVATTTSAIATVPNLNAEPTATTTDSSSPL